MDSLLEYRDCPNCGQDNFEVLFEANMKIADLQGGIETVYMLPGGKYGRHVKCRDCQLVYVNPIEKAGKINGDYTRMKSDGVSVIRGSRLRSTKSQVELIEKYKDGTRLLDIGCGEGFFLFNASRSGYNAKGIELSRDAVGYARGEFGLDVEEGYFGESKFSENCFDVVTLWQVLEHVPYPLQVLKEVRRILRTGGLLAVSTPDIGGIPAKILRRRWWNIRKLHLNQFTTKTLMSMLNNARFKDISSASYKESINLSMLFIPILKYCGVYGKTKSLFYSDSASGKIMNNVILAYPSRLDNCVVIGFK